MVLILKMWVEFDYIWMIELIVYFELVCELVLHLIFFDSWFEDFFDSAEETCSFVHADIDISEFAWTYAFTKLEVSDIELWSLILCPVCK